MTTMLSELSRLAARSIAVATLALAGVVLPAPAAVATVVHHLAGSFDGSATPAGALSNPNGIAIDRATGDVYVADIGNNVVDKFDASGTYLSQITGAGTPAGFFAFANPAAVAVDNSGGPDNGRVYVVDAGNDVIDEFDASGTYLGQLTGTPGGSFAGIYGVDVDNAGSVWIYEPVSRLDEFDASGAYVRSAPYPFGGSNPGFAVDSADDLYVVRGCGCTNKLDSSGSDLGTLDGGFSNSVAVDRSTDDVYVDDGGQINVYDSTQAAKESFGGGQLTNSNRGGVAVDASGDAYVANPADGKVYIFQPVTIASPTVTIDPPSNITTSHATFTGTVDPQGTNALSDTTWHFEYSRNGGASWTSTTGGDAGIGTSDVPVSDEVNSLLPNDDVQVRLVATNAGGTTTSPVQSFSTPAIAPTASTLQAQDLATTRAALEAIVNPEHSPTTYYFQLGTTTAYGSSVPVTQDADAGSGANPTAVMQQVHELEPNTTYHYRVVATNSVATVTGQDKEFTTPHAPASQSCSNVRFRTGPSSSLPDCRAFEMVSPPDKNGGDIMTDSQRTRAAADGSAVGFVSRKAFGDARGTGIATDYISARSTDPNPGTNGWSTHAITPLQQPIPLQMLLNGIDPRYVSEFSSDLSAGIFLSWKPLTPDPSEHNAMSIFLRRDLRTPGPGGYALLSSCPLCDATSTPLPQVTIPSQDEPYVAGASNGFRHVLFESYYNLTADAFGSDDKLYENSDGTVRLVGILPDGTPAASSIAGQGAGYGYTHLTPHTISADGTRVFFTVPQGSCGGFICGQLYMRVNGATTVQLNVSERSTPDPNPRPATYWDASVDGSRIFFTSTEALTDDAPVNGDEKLYLYDATKPDFDAHNLTLLNVDHEPADTQNDVTGLIGASDDGHLVYFVASGQLVSGAPLGSDRSVYLWHDGTVSYVGTFEPLSMSDNLNASWFFTVKQARVTPDGEALLFSSGGFRGPTGYNQGTCNDQNAGFGCRELYVYSAPSRELKCVSCNPTGAPATTDASVPTMLDTNGVETTNHLGRAISDDGSKVLFSTKEALAPQDVNGQSDVYEYDVPSGTVRLISDGRGAGAYFMDMSANGSDVFFVTRQQLVGWDHDGNYDLYDARVNGGFPDAVQAAACTGEGCLGAPSSAPRAISPGSLAFSGPGNVPPPVKAKPKPKRCRHGFVRKRVRGKVRCVKPKQHRHRHHAHARRTANHGRTR